ncbi:MAG: thermonuclease family protein [Candidatus Saccharibacteria bacterium]|nr:thermonuclease family protein [Pseudorhodobacter sp.]
MAVVILAYQQVATPLSTAETDCVVTRVIDGDTLRLTCAGMVHKVRLLGYDTPETYRPACLAEKRAGDAATKVLRAFVASAPVTQVQFAGQDVYGRDLAHVQIGGRDATAVMLASGLAQPYRGHQRPDWCLVLANTF